MTPADTLPRFSSLQGKRCVLGVTGGIAAYKAAELIRLLIKQEVDVRVVMTEAAREFVTPLTFQALSGNPVSVSQWPTHDDSRGMPHIDLSRQADCLLIAPCTANSMAKYAKGLANNLLDNLVLARNCPIAIAPAMNVEMWNNPATQRNLQQLKSDGFDIFGPGNGLQACGETGDGRMLEPWQIVTELARMFTPKALTGQKVLITAGPTFEAIDPVRGITNRSSGKMGYAMAQAAWLLGAEVTLVSGPVNQTVPYGVRAVQVESAVSMHNAVMNEIANQTLFVGVAAVADFGIRAPSEHKQKKTEGKAPGLDLEFTLNPDILADVGEFASKSTSKLTVVGFAAETQNLDDYAQSKLTRKKAHFILGNLAQESLGSDNVKLTLYQRDHAPLPIEIQPKLQAAQAALQIIANHLS